MRNGERCPYILSSSSSAGVHTLVAAARAGELNEHSFCSLLSGEFISMQRVVLRFVAPEQVSALESVSGGAKHHAGRGNWRVGTRFSPNREERSDAASLKLALLICRLTSPPSRCTFSHLGCHPNCCLIPEHTKWSHAGRGVRGNSGMRLLIAYGVVLA